MLPGHIKDGNVSLGAPKNWDKGSQGVCSNLVVRVETTNAGVGITSAWYPNQDEIDRIKDGAPVYLTIIGDVHPPVCMEVGPKPD